MELEECLERGILTCYTPPVFIYDIQTGKKIGEIGLDNVEEVKYGTFLDENTILFSIRHSEGESSIMEYDCLRKKEIRRTESDSNKNIWHILNLRGSDLIVTSSWDNNCRVLKYSDFSLMTKIEHNGDVNHAECFDLRNEILTSADDGIFRSFSLDKNKITNEIELKGMHTCSKYIDQKKSIVCLSGKTFHQFDVSNIRSGANSTFPITDAENDMYSLYVSPCQNLISCGGFDYWSLVDIRKNFQKICGGYEPTLGEVWRQQHFGKDEICVGSKRCGLVYDWNGKLKREFTTKDGSLFCFAYRKNQLRGQLGSGSSKQAKEDLMERVLYLRDNYEDYRCFKVRVGGCDTLCFFSIFVV